MIRLNPDPQTGGYAYMPIRSVTSHFPAGSDVQGVLRALKHAGFRDDQVDVFTGEMGADRLDTEGRLHGVWVRFVRSLQDMFTDEAPLFHRADETMRSGGECGGRVHRGAGAGAAAGRGNPEIAWRDRHRVLGWAGNGIHVS